MFVGKRVRHMVNRIHNLLLFFGFALFRGFLFFFTRLLLFWSELADTTWLRVAPVLLACRIGADDRLQTNLVAFNKAPWPGIFAGVLLADPLSPGPFARLAFPFSAPSA